VLFRLLALSLALVLMLFTGGCWDQREVETLGLVDGMALERGAHGQIKVTLQILNSRAISHSAGAGPVQGIKAYQNFSAQGQTVDHALTMLNRIIPRRPFYSSLRLVVVSEDLARERDLRELLDFLTRSREVRRNAWFVVSRSPISRLFDENTPLSMTPSSQVEAIMHKSELSGFYAVTPLSDVIKGVAAQGSSPVAAGLVVIRSAFQAPPDMEARHVMLPEPFQSIVLSGAAVFREGHLAGWLNEEESNGLLWVQGKRGGAIEVPTGNSMTSLNLLHSRAAVKMGKTGGQPSIFVRIDAETVVGETDSTITLTKDTDYTELEQGAGRIVQKEVGAALSKALAGYRSDIFGFSQVVHRSDPKLWKTIKDTWSDQLPQLPVSVEAHVKVTTSGLTSKPLLDLH